MPVELLHTSYRKSQHSLLCAQGQAFAGGTVSDKSTTRPNATYSVDILASRRIYCGIAGHKVLSRNDQGVR